MIKKIVVVGPESTGKSSLCKQLADHYNTVWVKEYARDYLLTNGTAYTFDNLLEIAHGQLALEDSTIEKYTRNENSQAGPVFVDTDMYVMKVWCEFVFDRCHRWILDKIIERKYDLYLLCDIDLPWIKDELREYPDLLSRKKLYHYYKDILINQSVPWINITGSYEGRLEKALAAVEKILK